MKGFFMRFGFIGFIFLFLRLRMIGHNIDHLGQHVLTWRSRPPRKLQMLCISCDDASWSPGTAPPSSLLLPPSSLLFLLSESSRSFSWVVASTAAVPRSWPLRHRNLHCRQPVVPCIMHVSCSEVPALTIYVCMYLCIYVSMYVCMYVCQTSGCL